MLVCGVLQELLEAEGRHNKVMAAKAAEIAALRSEEARGTFFFVYWHAIHTACLPATDHNLTIEAAVHLSWQVR